MVSHVNLTKYQIQRLNRLRNLENFGSVEREGVSGHISFRHFHQTVVYDTFKSNEFLHTCSLEHWPQQ